MAEIAAAIRRILDGVIRNKYANNPVKLTAWTPASHTKEPRKEPRRRRHDLDQIRKSSRYLFYGGAGLVDILDQLLKSKVMETVDKDKRSFHPKSFTFQLLLTNSYLGYGGMVVNVDLCRYK